MFVNVNGVELMIPESHKPLGTPLSSPGAPLVPLVVEWKVACQSQMTESFTEIETIDGENVSLKLGPTSTLVVAAEDFCAKATQNSTVATMRIAVLTEVFTITKRWQCLFLFQTISKIQIEVIYSDHFFARGKFR